MVFLNGFTGEQCTCKKSNNMKAITIRFLAENRIDLNGELFYGNWV